MTLFDWLTFAGIIVSALIYTLSNIKKIRSSEAYFVSDRQTKLFALTATLVMTELNTSTLVGFASLGYAYGQSALSLPLVFLIGLTFYALAVAKKWKNFNGIAVTTFFSQRFHPALGYFAALIMLIALMGFSANYLKSLTLLFEPLFPHLSLWSLSGFFSLIMLAATLNKGLAAVIRIDRFSFLITLLVFITLLFTSWHIDPKNGSDAQQNQMPEGMVTSLTIITMFTYILSPWYGQKLFAADNAKTAFYGVVIAGIFVTLFYGIAIFSTSQLAQLNIQHLTPDQALPYLFSHRFPMIIKGAGYALLFLIALTTIASLWNTIASIISVHSQQKISIQTNRLITMLIAFLSFILANIFIDEIFNKMVLMNIPIASLSFGLLAGFYWRNCRIIAVVVSIIVGMTGGFGCYYIIGSDQYMWYWAIYIIPLQFFVGIITNLLVTYARH